MRIHKSKFLWLLTLACFAFQIPARSWNLNQPVRTIHIDQPGPMALDPNGYLYVVSKDYTLYKFNEQGEILENYNSLQNGPISSIDASNPLEILVYYGDFSKLQILDRKLSPKWTLDLNNLNLFNNKAVARAEDGNFWLYREGTTELIKINRQSQILQTSIDLRTETQSSPQATFLLAAGKQVFLGDSLQGIYVFDDLGTYLHQLPFKGIKNLQYFNGQIVWYREGYLYRYALNGFGDPEKIAIPPSTKSALIYKDLLLLQTGNKIEIFD